MSYINEPFQDLDVMNNFMFNKLTTDPSTSDSFCRLLIKNLINKEVGHIIVKAESIKLPDNPEKRGVRLDVEISETENNDIVTNIYDIEPHRDKEISFEKKNRFVQAHIDKNTIDSGNNVFGDMPALYIINITNYDPFGYNQMVYTIKNQCREVPELVYNDEVTIYYFNTSGTKGGSPELKAFLDYLEDSTMDNVVDAATREVDSYVHKIKYNNQIRGDYMTVGEWFDNMTKEVVNEAVATAVAEKDATIADKDATIADKDAAIADKDAAIADKDAEILRLKKELEDLKTKAI